MSTEIIQAGPKVNFSFQDLVEIDKPKFVALEVSPSRMTSNTNVKWMLVEFARLYKSLYQRINIKDNKLIIETEMMVWWEVEIRADKIKFYVVVPDKPIVKDSLKKQIMKTWKQSNVREVPDYKPSFDPSISSVTNLSLESNPVLSLDTTNPSFSPLDSILNTKNYLKDDDKALLQIGMKPLSPYYYKTFKDTLSSIRKTGRVPMKKGSMLSKGNLANKLAYLLVALTEELLNLFAGFIIPGWEDDRTATDAMSQHYGSYDSLSTTKKSKDDNFRVNIRAVSSSVDDNRREAIVRTLSSVFDPMAGDNRVVSIDVPRKELAQELKRIEGRKITYRMTEDVLSVTELSKMIAIPDQKAQIEHYNELNVVEHRSSADVPKEIFEDDGEGFSFGEYQWNDGEYHDIFFNGKNKNHLCMPRIGIGEPGTGKSTFGANFAIRAFFKGYGSMVIDAADGKLIQKILNCIPPDLLHKVRIIDFLNSEYPIGMGLNEIFQSRNSDVIEDLVVEELIAYIELVGGNEINMRAKQWVENAIKATFVTPSATLQDVENMLNNATFREAVIPTIEDPELKKDWEYYHLVMTPEDRQTIYNEAFRRLSPVMRKKALKNFILQRPKKDEEGRYLLDLRKWMDEGYLVLVRANETLGETIQTALVSYLLTKFNLAIISREDIENEDDRRPCFLILDEPDHYIKGSERWRNMLTRYRKYRCGLLFLFHGWQQLVEADKNLPKIIRKAGPHYIIFQTDEENLKELKPVIEPEFKISDIAKGMPQWHAVVRLKMFTKEGNNVPAFMMKSLGDPCGKDSPFTQHNNNHLYEECSKLLGKPKVEVMHEIFHSKAGGEFGEGAVLQGEEYLDEPIKPPTQEEVDNSDIVKSMYEEMESYIKNSDGDADPELILHFEELIEEEEDNGK